MKILALFSVFLSVVLFNLFVNPILNLISLLLISLILAQILISINQIWVSLILILIYSGGMLVLFLFIVSLTPNFKNNYIIRTWVIIITIPIYLIVLSQKGFPSTFIFYSFPQNRLLTLGILCLALILFLFLIIKILIIPRKNIKTIL